MRNRGQIDLVNQLRPFIGMIWTKVVSYISTIFYCTYLIVTYSMHLATSGLAAYLSGTAIGMFVDKNEYRKHEDVKSYVNKFLIQSIDFNQSKNQCQVIQRYYSIQLTIQQSTSCNFNYWKKHRHIDLLGVALSYKFTQPIVPLQTTVAWYAIRNLVYQANKQANVNEESYDDSSLLRSNPGPSSSSGSKNTVWQYLTIEIMLTRQVSYFRRP